jgi:hypothetical protein
MENQRQQLVDRVTEVRTRVAQRNIFDAKDGLALCDAIIASATDDTGGGEGNRPDIHDPVREKASTF